MPRKKRPKKALTSHGKRSGRTPRTCTHDTCGSSSTVDGPDLRRVCDPYVDSIGPRCDACGEQFPFAEFTWDDTSESLTAFRKRMRALIPDSHNRLHERLASLSLLLSIVLAGCCLWFVPGIIWKLLSAPIAVFATWVICSISIDFLLHKVMGSVDPQIEI